MPDENEFEADGLEEQDTDEQFDDEPGRMSELDGGEESDDFGDEGAEQDDMGDSEQELEQGFEDEGAENDSEPGDDFGGDDIANDDVGEGGDDFEGGED
jgi:hypothetical protein